MAEARHLHTLPPVWITGFGCISALGPDHAKTAQALREGRDGFRRVSLFSTEGCQTDLAGEIAAEYLKGFKDQPLPPSAHRVSLLLWQAWEQAVAIRPDFVPEAAVFGTTSGGMSFGEEFFRGLREGQPLRDFRERVREYVPQQAALDLIQTAGWEISPLIVSNACASGSNAIGQAARLVAHGWADRVVCGGYDALSQLVFAGFDSLRALSPHGCKPFAADRAGLLLGEGAAVFLLESEKSRAAAGVRPLARVAGYGASTDNFHLTQPEPGGWGPRTAMQAALADAGLDGGELDYINAHGTGTAFNDSSEGAALLEVAPSVPVSSTKALTGHALGAAGAIEAAFCVLALQENFLPLQAHCESPDPALPLPLVRSSTPLRPVRQVLSNSFGFGGSNASLVLLDPDS
jgi:3-oxoacyl-[acyl-carrier-protein] synthase II